MDVLNPQCSLRWSFQERSFLGRIALLCVLLFGLHSQLFGQTNGTWTNTSTTASVGWSTAAAWLNSIVAGGAGSTATITANQTVNKQINFVNTGTTTLGVINIGDPDGSNGYTLSGSSGASLTFDNNNANAQFNVVSGSGTVTLASGVQSVVLNDNLIISQSSSSLLTWATPTKGGSGTDVKIIEHGGSGSGGVTISGVIANGDAGTGAVSVRQNNSNGTMTLSGANTYSGGTTVDAGTLALGANNRLSDTGALTINGGTFDMRTFSDTVGAVTINGGSLSNGTLTGTSYSVTGGTISAVLAGTGVALTKTGAGTTVLSGANSYSGGTFLNGGVLSVSSKANFANKALTFDGGTLEATASFSDLTSANDTTLNAGGGTIRIGAGLTNSWGTASISGTGGLTKEGDGVLTLGSVATTYSGGTTVNAGTLALSVANRLSDTGTLTINGGTFDMMSFSDAVGVVTVNGGSLSNGTLTGTSYSVTGGTISAVLAGAGGLTKTGTGTTVLSGANTYAGGTFLNGGVLSVSSKANFANKALTFDGGTLEATASFSDLTSVNATTLNAGGGTIRIGAGLTNSWGSAIISGTGGLTKEGDGVLTLAANNTYAGGTVINRGTLSIDTSARINSNNGGLTFNGGTLRTTGTLGFTKSTTLLAGGGTFEVANGTINTWNAPISGDGQLTKIGAGQLSLTAETNSYKGSTLVREGTLALYGSLSSSLAFSNGTSLILRTTNSIPSSVAGNITFPSNCVLNFENTNGLSGAGPFTLITATTSISGSPSLASSLTNYVLTNTGTALILSLAGSTPASGYANYLSSIGMPSNTAFNANVNGATIGLMYAFGSPNGSPQNNGVTAVPVMIGDQLTYSFDVKNDSNLTVTYQTSIDLVAWTDPQPVSAGTGASPTGFLKKQVQVTGSGKLFVRIKVTHP